MPKTAKAKKKVSKPKTKVVSKPKATTAKVATKGPVKISKTYIPKDTEKYMCEKHKVYFRMRLTEWKKELIKANNEALYNGGMDCLLYTSPSPRDRQKSRMPSSA